MAGYANRFGPRGIEMYADWTDRIASGELPPIPQRPDGIERNVVITQWDWGSDSSYIHDEITTDKRDASLNAGGKVYAVDGGHGALLELDPNTHEWKEIVIAVKNNPDNPAVTRFAQEFPVPSAYYGDEALWKRPADPHNPMFDELGRVWMTTKVRVMTCRSGVSLVLITNLFSIIQREEVHVRLLIMTQLMKSSD